MSRIAGWNKSLETKDRIVWKHIFYNTKVVVAKTQMREGGRGGWCVAIFDRSPNPIRGYPTTSDECFKYKKDAIEFARLWMKKYSRSRKDNPKVIKNANDVKRGDILRAKATGARFKVIDIKGRTINKGIFGLQEHHKIFVVKNLRTGDIKEYSDYYLPVFEVIKRY